MGLVSLGGWAVKRQTGSSKNVAAQQRRPLEAISPKTDNRLHQFDANILLQQELDQAWSHYRHLEEMRYKYLSALITLLTASAAALLAGIKFLLPGNGSLSNVLALGLSYFISLLFVWSALFLTAMIRIGYVLNAYEDIINTTHEHFWGHHSNAHRMWCVRDRIPQDIRGHFFSLQKNAVLLLYVVGLALATLQLVLEWELWRRSHYLYRPPLIMAAIMLLALGWIFSANLRGLRQRSNIECKPSPFIPLF
jgi:hypothetical protein